MNLCAACARQGKTCCQGTDILLTSRDLNRITRHTGLPAISERRKPRDPSCLGDEGDPNWLLYTLGSDGTRRVLPTSPPGTAPSSQRRAAGCPWRCAR